MPTRCRTGRACRASTEQVLHPERYARGDVPLAVTIDTMPGMIVRDVLGEFETGILIAALTGFPRPDELPALGWGGDQYSVISTADRPAPTWSSTTAPRRMRSTVVSVPGFATPSARAIVPNSRA